MNVFSGILDQASTSPDIGVVALVPVDAIDLSAGSDRDET